MHKIFTTFGQTSVSQHFERLTRFRWPFATVRFHFLCLFLLLALNLSILVPKQKGIFSRAFHTDELKRPLHSLYRRYPAHFIYFERVTIPYNGIVSFNVNVSPFSKPEWKNNQKLTRWWLLIYENELIQIVNRFSCNCCRCFINDFNIHHLSHSVAATSATAPLPSIH